MNSSRFILLSVLLFGLNACRTIAPTPESGNLISRSTYPYQMAPLDEAKVVLTGGEALTIKISGDGTSLIGDESHEVAGLSDADFRKLVRRRYPDAQKIVINEFRPNKISVLGEVYHQLNAELADGPMRLMDGLAGANGFTALANKRRVRLIRQNGGVIEVYEFDLRRSMRGEDMEQNILLQPGDTITVPRNFL